MYPISKLGTEVEKPDDLPLDPHWQIWVQEDYVRHTGYEAEHGPQGKSYKWRTYVYVDHSEWVTDLRELHARSMDPTRQSYSKHEFVAFEAGGRVEARVNIELVGKPPTSSTRRAP